MSESADKASLPTYQTIADVLEKKNGSGIRLVGWTVLRSLLIAPPMLLVGVPAKKAFAQVQTLRSQRAQLLAIWPEKQAKLDEQFNDSVMVLAEEVYEALFDLTP